MKPQIIKTIATIYASLRNKITQMETSHCLNLQSNDRGSLELDLVDGQVETCSLAAIINT